MALTLSEAVSNRLTDVAAQYNMDPEELLLTLLNAQEEIDEDSKEEDLSTVLTVAIADSDAGHDIPFEEFVAEREAFWQKRGKSLGGK